MITILLSLAILFSKAQTDSVSKTINADEAIDKSFQKEFVYLHSQKESMLKQKKRSEELLNEKIRLAKSQTMSWQKEGVTLGGQNDERHEELMELDRRKKDLQKRGMSLESTFKKAQTALVDYAAGLHFDPVSKDKMTVIVPEDLSVAQFEDVFQKANELLEASSRVEMFPGNFLSQENKVVNGNITRFGRVAAVGSIGETHYVLGPNGEGMLKVLETSPAPSEPLLNLYIFQSMAKAALIKKQGTVVEKIADFSPIFFLALILMLIVGLFTSLIRV